MQPFLLLLAFLLTPGAGTEEIIGGHEAKPHSRPYMAFVQFLQEKSRKRCCGILVRKDFVLTAAHCQGSSINVTLGAHNITERERTQQLIPVKRPIPHPAYNPKNFSNDIMLLQGDSGGPLVCKDVAQGILSYGNKKGTPPGVYIKVSHFLPWIKRTMKRL
ncbi:granzyme H isoform X2 [Pan paniscus]|uniref:Granzyme H n=1 Tax=Pan paniscus TaxID=9597 RepID=A0A2R9B8H8_PANPA|nr:granzyme H isoform X2 [Pan paniscus]